MHTLKCLPSYHGLRAGAAWHSDRTSRVQISREQIRLRSVSVALESYLDVDGDLKGANDRSQAAAEDDMAPGSCGSSLASELGIDEAMAEWFTAQRPDLVASSRLVMRVRGIAKLLRCTSQQAAATLHKQPALLDQDSSTIRQRLSSLAAALGDDMHAACQSARRVPILLASNTPLDTCMLQVAAVFELDATNLSKAVRLVGKEPSLLVLLPETLRERLEALPETLGLRTPAEAVALCRANPWLLTVSPRSIRSKLAALGATLRMSRGAVLKIALAYPRVLSFSEHAQAAKVAAMTELIPLSSLQTMVSIDPSLLARSSGKVMESLRSVQQATGKPMKDAIGLVERRPAILAKAPTAPARCYKVLSIWKFSKEEKDAMLQKHPLLLQLSPRELHLRCRWLRSLITGNGYYHVALRRISPPLVAVIIMHLPKAWSRLQYLVDCNQEQMMGLMDAVQFRDADFEERFPLYRKWLNFKISEMGCQKPWRQPPRPKEAPAWKKKRDAEIAAAALDGIDDAKSTGRVEEIVAPEFAWHAAHSAESVRPGKQAVVSEAGVVYFGVERVHKPRRVIYTSAAPDLGDAEAAVSHDGAAGNHLGATGSQDNGNGGGMNGAVEISERQMLDAPIQATSAL